MKLASLKTGRSSSSSERDGRLVVVSRDLTHCVDASHIAPNLQAALDDSGTIFSHLADLAESLANRTLKPGGPVPFYYEMRRKVRRDIIRIA